jgi:hypothetical protein
MVQTFGNYGNAIQRVLMATENAATATKFASSEANTNIALAMLSSEGSFDFQHKMGGTVRGFPTEICTRGCHWFPRMLA